MMPAAIPARSGPSNLIQHNVSRQLNISIQRNTKNFVGKKMLIFKNEPEKLLKIKDRPEKRTENEPKRT
jgi:hypothetical protein